MNLKELKRILIITIGAALLASGVVLFLYPAKIMTGGTPGLGLIIHYLSGISIGVAMLIINIPLLLLGKKYLDLKFALRTVYAMIMTSVMIDLLVYFFEAPEIKSLLLSTLYGGICIGAGIGLVLKANASAGGTSIIARVISSKTNLKPGNVILFLDAIIVISVAIIFKNFEGALWSILSIYASTKVIDKIVTGGISEKLVNIVSDKTDEIAQAIHSQMDRDGTILSGQNIMRKHDKEIIFLVVNIRRIPELKNIVLEIDPQAFMIVTEASDMIGTSRRYG
jgi:uncharacterized membrane-anchored protein YitT (DUF2179 family)